MDVPIPIQLADWGSFYIIVGSAAAGLTGLMFVVITLGAEARAIGTASGLRAFVTPTVIHFCVVLVLAAFMIDTNHSATTLGLGIGACGVGGIAYVWWSVLAGLRMHEHNPLRSDWLWHGVFPVITYLVLVVAAAMIFAGVPALALNTLAVAVVVLLLIGVHNAWDSAMWMAHSAQRLRDQQMEEVPDPEDDTAA